MFVWAAITSAVMALSACKRPEDAPATSAATSDTPSSQTEMANNGAAPATTAMNQTDRATRGNNGMSPNDMMTANPTSAGMPAATPLNSADSSFVKKAAGSGLYEVAVAKLAADKATDPAVKTYAEMLVDHHMQANSKLQQVASAKGLTLPTDMPADLQKKIDQLSKESGAAFDKKFIQTVGIGDHKTNIALFEKESKNAKDADLRNFAEATLPTLREHLSAAQKMQGKSGS